MAEFHYEIRGHKCKECGAIHPDRWFCIMARDLEEVRRFMKWYGAGAQWRRLPNYRPYDKWKKEAP